jgi:hypothetical protein
MRTSHVPTARESMAIFPFGQQQAELSTGHFDAKNRYYWQSVAVRSLVRKTTFQFQK